MKSFASAVLAASLLCGPSGPVRAETQIGNFVLNGNAGAGWIGPDSEGLRGYADMTLSIPLGSSPFGFDIGLTGQSEDDGFKHETYGALTLSGDMGKMSLGVVRPAYDFFAASSLSSQVPLLAHSRRTIKMTQSRMTSGAMYAGYVPFGASAISAPGDVQWGVSIHNDPHEDLRAGSLGLSFRQGDVTVSGAVESVSDGRVGAKAQLSREFGGTKAGIGYYHPSAHHQSNVLEGFADIAVSEKLSMGVVLQDAIDDSGLASVGANYALTPTDRVNAAATYDWNETVLTLGFDHRF